MQLQRSLPEIQRAGLGLVAVSYDSTVTLAAFADKHGITFPLLSDQDSKTITAWGILNREATGRTAGIPYPGTYVLDTRRVIVSRNFEQAYQERDSAAKIIAGLQPSRPGAPGAAGTEVIGKYVKLRLAATDTIAAPGHHITLTVDIIPGPKIHVYAPGQTGYIPIALTLNDSPDWQRSVPRFPSARPFVDPVGEKVQVYDRPFRVTQEIALTLTPSMRTRASARERLQLTGALEYQACDDKVCYRPETIPLQWTIQLTPLEP